MTQFRAIFKKEYRQQGSLAAAMLLLCFFVQLAAFTVSLFSDGFGRLDPAFFEIALLMTALFTGAAAAISFAGEHDEKTFGFLRNLPVSSMIVMFGKTAWLICGTIIVLALSLLLGLGWNFILTNHNPTLTWNDAFGSFGVGIIEAFVWGLFWSPRCRSQVHALLATYFCASSISYSCAMYYYANSGIIESYCHAAPLRLGIIAVVGVFAVYGMLKWFDRATQRATRYNLPKPEFRGFFRYPQTSQSPFFALLHQSVRQSSTMLLFGAIISLFFCSILLFYGFSGLNEMKAENSGFYINVLMFGCIPFYIVFCGSIFAQDQKNHSFRFLSRCGISARKVWWSRILPFFVTSFPALLAVFYANHVARVNHLEDRRYYFVSFSFELAVIVVVWFVPFATGAFLSIYCRSMIVSVALTGALSGLILCWTLLGFVFCMSNPVWTTLPVSIMLLVASRLYAANWLRERQTWRTRFVPLTPFFVAFLVILGAIPFVRIYSIPFVSLEEVEALLNQTDLPERMSPEKQKAVFNEVAARRNTPLTSEDVPGNTPVSSLYFAWQSLRSHPDFLPENISSHPEKAKQTLVIFEKQVEDLPTFDEWLLRHYEFKYRTLHSNSDIFQYKDFDELKWFNRLYRFLPWERTRLLRRFNVQPICALKSTMGRINYDSLEQFQEIEEKIMSENRLSGSKGPIGLLDLIPWQWRDGSDSRMYYASVGGIRLSLVKVALNIWYVEHNNTLPESLGELVGGYLHKIPTNPNTGEAMEYYWRPEELETDKADRELRLRHNAGWSHLQFGKTITDLDFLPGFEDYRKSRSY